jgi:NAD(P)-dependent dehydrogenase (short-subunit alcohol dehydrogenase family)
LDFTPFWPSGDVGDNVYATMRDPSVDNELLEATKSESLSVAIRGLDVTYGVAIREVVVDVLTKRGGIDVLVNNGGIGFVQAYRGAR